MKTFLHLATLLVMILALSACGGGPLETTSLANTKATAVAVSPDEIFIPADSPKLSRIKMAKVEDAVVSANEVTAPGKIGVNPNRVSHVVLPLAGRVASVSAKIGDFIQKGQVVLTVESPDIDTAVSTLQQAESTVIQARATLAKAQADMDRARDLFDHNAIAQKEVINAEAMLAQAKASVDQNQSVVQQARRRIEILGVEPGQFGQKISVRAPIDGKVLELTVVQGEYRNDTSASLMTIADLSSVWVSAQVPETSIRLIQIGERIQVDLAAYPGESFSGRVTQIADTVDPQTRTIEVRAELENSKGRLRPEMFGQIRHIDRTETRPVVPVAAVVQEEGRNLVWVETAPGRFRRTPVETGPRTGDRQAIIAGLQKGDRVVVDGVMLLRTN